MRKNNKRIPCVYLLYYNKFTDTRKTSTSSVETTHEKQKKNHIFIKAKMSTITTDNRVSRAWSMQSKYDTERTLVNCRYG